MSRYLAWLQQGLAPTKAQLVTRDNLELIIEHVRWFIGLHEELQRSSTNDKFITWAQTPVVKDMFQIMPIKLRSLHFPKGDTSKMYDCLYPQGEHCIVRALYKIQDVRIDGTTRFFLFGTTPENTLCLASHTERSGRLYKYYLNDLQGARWIRYGISQPAPGWRYGLSL